MKGVFLALKNLKVFGAPETKGFCGKKMQAKNENKR